MADGVSVPTVFDRESFYEAVISQGVPRDRVRRAAMAFVPGVAEMLRRGYSQEEIGRVVSAVAKIDRERAGHAAVARAPEEKR